MTAPGGRSSTALRLDLVGCGEAMQRLHAPAIGSRDASVVRGCFDLNAANARKVAEMTSATEVGPPRAVRPDDPVDAAIIATPPEAHAEVARLYLSAGKHVFIEKPVTARVAELEELIELSDRMGRRVIVGHFRRFFPSVRVARRLIDLGTLGRIVHVEASEGFRWEWAPRSNYVVESPYGGVLHDTGSHLIDMALFILSLDDEQGTTVGITSVEKAPAREPSQRCEFVVRIDSTRFGFFDARVALSRMGPLAKGVKIWGEKGVLFVPAQFAAAPVLRTSQDCLVISESSEGTVPASMWHSVVRTHEDFLASIRDPGLDTVLDVRRFALLMRLLEEVWEARPV